MFTGLIAEVGSVEAIDRDEAGARLRIAADVGGELAPGDSVAVSGACLTAVEPGPGGFAADVMNQTLELTALGALEPGSPVNLEPAVRASDRLGGHIVQGHVDGDRHSRRRSPRTASPAGSGSSFRRGWSATSSSAARSRSTVSASRSRESRGVSSRSR